MPTAQKPNFAIRFFPSLADVAFLMPLALLYGPMNGAKALLNDGDTGWHLRTGEWILANGRVPHQDLFSFTKPGETWFAWEWLWDVIFGWLHLHGGLAAVVLASTLVLCCISALLFHLVRRRADNDFVAIAVTFLAVVTTSLHWLARPHLMTMLFVLVFYAILDRSRNRSEGPGRSIWLLMPLMALWTNLHGGFLAGILLILAYAAGELAAAAVQADTFTRRAALARGRIYLLLAGGCSAITLVNPYGYRLHLHLYSYLTDGFLYDHVIEFMPFNFRQPAGVFYELLFVLGIVAIFVSFARKDFGEAFLLLGWTHLALLSQRNIPLYGLLAAPAIAGLLNNWLRRLQAAAVAAWIRRFAKSFVATAGEFGAVDRVPRWHVISLALPALVGILLSAPAAPPKFRAQHDAKKFPVAALEFLVRGGDSGAVFTTDQWGDYLIYRLHPAKKVFVDGRSDFYGAKFDEQYLSALLAGARWQKTLDRYGVNTVLLPVAVPLVGTLKESRRWHVVYDDGHAIAFRSVAALDAAGRNPTVMASSGTPCDREIAKHVCKDTTTVWSNGGDKHDQPEKVLAR